MLNIIDPLTNNTYNLFSKLGKETLKKYIMQCQNGGSEDSSESEVPYVMPEPDKVEISSL